MTSRDDSRDHLAEECSGFVGCAGRESDEDVDPFRPRRLWKTGNAEFLELIVQSTGDIEYLFEGRPRHRVEVERHLVHFLNVGEEREPLIQRDHGERRHIQQSLKPSTDQARNTGVGFVWFLSDDGHTQTIRQRVGRAMLVERLAIDTVWKPLFITSGRASTTGSAHGAIRR